MTPQFLPILKPMQEAVDFQLQRVPKTRKEIDELELDARSRALYVTGLLKRSILEQTHALAVKRIAEGMTKSEFAEELGALADKHGGVILSPERLELIDQNNLAIATASGRYKQLTDPTVLRERPFWQYPLGPSDNRTSAICKGLEGLIARHDDPIWQHIYPPNHHKERHLKVLTLSEDDAQETGNIYESAGDRAYPFVGGREILPDPGFDVRPGTLSGSDPAHLQNAARELGDDVPAKSPHDYELPALSKYKAIAMPKAGAAIADATDAEEYDAALERFRAALAWTRGESLIVGDAVGDGAIVNERSFDQLVGLAGDDREARRDAAKYFDLVRPLLEDPHEVWIVERARGDARTFTKRYFGVFKTKGSKTPIAGFLEVSPEGWVMDGRFTASFDELEELRHGWLTHRRGGTQ
ncbi:MAG TPA: PBECR2 nuclease fold domain-containing protein [Thermoanaerobaculia bacterium]|nr:PBECR2 nuclease fold domain-containing protein [Thermoanaerobaculia bacterium]